MLFHFLFLIFYIFVSYEDNIPFLLAAHYCQLSNAVIYTHLQTLTERDLELMRPGHTFYCLNSRFSLPPVFCLYV